MDFEGAFFDTSDFKLTEKLLGEGSFGKVYIVERKSDNSKFAAKLINAKGLMNGRDQEKFLREAQILHKLNHPAIVKFLGINFHSFNDPNIFQPIIITEYISKGSLQKILFEINNGTNVPEWNATKKYICLIGIAIAMQYLHDNRIIHRDLKPLNVLIDDQFYPHVCDFGISRCFTNEIANAIQMKMTGLTGTPVYMAPEQFVKNAFYGSSVDVYAFAITAYEVISCEFAWFGEEIIDIILKVQNGIRPKFNSKFSDKMKDLIERCWSDNPYNRPTFSEIVFLLSNDFSHSKEQIDEVEVNNYINMLKGEKKTEIHNSNKNNTFASLLFDIKKLKIEKQLGQGIVGTFYKAILPRNDGKKSTEYTLKILKNMNEQDNQRKFLDSIEIQSLMKHNAVLQVVGFSIPFGGNNQFTSVSEFPANGSLQTLLDKVKAGKQPKDWETTRAIIIFGIAAGMAYIHQNDVVLGDLRTETVFLDSDNRPKIGGFVNAFTLKNGSSCFNKSALLGIHAYLAPELVENENMPYNHKIDVYAYAMILYSIFTLKDPVITSAQTGKRPNFEENEIPKEFAELIRKCWSGDPDTRPSFLSIVQQFIIRRQNFFDKKLIKEDELEAYMEISTKDLAFW